MECSLRSHRVTLLDLEYFYKQTLPIWRCALQNTSFFTLPNTNIHTLGPIAELDFFDTQSVLLNRPITPLEAWRIIMSQPSPVLGLAFRVRDIISSKFGVKEIGGFSSTPPKEIAVGQKLDFFLVEYSSEDVLTLSERDSHLDVLTCITKVDNQLSITSSVKIHNAFGRAYMLPVAPAHKLIVRSFLKRLKNETG